MNPTGLERLRLAIVQRAAQDYIQALKTIRRHGDRLEKKHHYYCTYASEIVEECEQFFREGMDYYIEEFDGEWLIGKLREQSKTDTWQIKRQEV